MLLNSNIKPKFSILIVSYNRTELLKRCIDSVLKYTRNFELLIWDNNSNEYGRKEYLKSIDTNKKIRVFYSDLNLGCGGGREKVSKYAEGDYIVFLDDDMEVRQDWLTDLKILIDSEDRIAGVSAVIVNMPKNEIMMRGCKLREYEKMISISPIDSGKLYSEKTVLISEYCDLIGGGGVIFKKKIFDKFSIDNNYNRALEDYDFSMQINRAGYKFVNSNKSIIYHWQSKVSENYSEYNEERYKLNLIARDYEYFREKWGKELAGGVFYGLKGFGFKEYLLEILADYPKYFKDISIRNYFKGAIDLISDSFEKNSDIKLSDELFALINSIIDLVNIDFEIIQKSIYRFASVLEKQGKFEFAVILFEFLKKNNDIQIKSGCLYHLGQILFNRKKFKKSKEYLQECIKLSEHKNAYNLLNEIKNHA